MNPSFANIRGVLECCARARLKPPVAVPNSVWQLGAL
jgi:hypothetical protein